MARHSWATRLLALPANASLDLFETEPRLQQTRIIEAQLRNELEEARSLAGVRDVRVKGAIGVVELEKLDRNTLRKKFVDRGVWIRPVLEHRLHDATTDDFIR